MPERLIRTLDFSPDGTPALQEITVAPATDAETANTIKVMGGADWARWITALADRGAAKQDLEQTPVRLPDDLSSFGGRALTSVNGAAVTQASTAIPGIALYVSILRAVLGERMQTMSKQSLRLWDLLTGAVPLDLDDQAASAWTTALWPIDGL